MTKLYENCKTYNTGIEKPHTIQIDNRLISIVYYSVCLTDNPVFFAAATDRKGNIYNIYCYNHKTWTGYLAFPLYNK